MVGPSDVNWQGRKIKGVVNDLDGTITDSIEVTYEILRETTAMMAGISGILDLLNLKDRLD